ncbi:MAG: ABC transporter substrate-binding protein [Lachnospiraceae bacterium]|nr:ABC transporter substrate-binding protein [Lachnospiraceae bacterium]
MKVIWKKVLTAAALSVMACIAGCSHKEEKKPKPQPQATAVVDNGNIDAQGKGNGQSDVPLVIGCDKLSKKFNPFIAKTVPDQQAVSLTQLYLTGNDRQGRIVYNGIDGEVRTYNGSNYTYYGPADIETRYNSKKDETLYYITLRDDLKFSDGEPVTIDDVLFTIYVLCDKNYKGGYKLGSYDIKGLSRYQKNKNVKNIAGIRRLGNYKMSIATNGFDASMVQSLKIPICPLHYYGNIEKYNYSKKKFGFKKGDISTVCANKTSPVGAGPYRFVKYEQKVIYYTSNEIYYKGCPQIAYVQLKEMKEILNATQAKIDSQTGQETVPENENPEDTKKEPVLNRSAEALEMTEGTVDVLDTVLSKEDISWVSYANSNGEISGNKISTSFLPTGVYQYIGINPDNVRAGTDAYSEESRNLRKAFATAFSAFRSILYDYYADGTCIIQYPCSSASWLCNSKEDINYSQAYNKNINGDAVNKDNLKKAVLSYLGAAGYTIDGTSVTGAPAGADTEYSIIVAGGRNNPLYQFVSQTADFFKEIGITLDIVQSGDTKAIKKRIAKGRLQLWAGRCDTGKDYNLYKRYAGSESLFGIKEPKFVKLAKRAEAAVKDSIKKKKYQGLYDNILEMAVEVPVIEQQSAIMCSSSRINTDTMAKDITVYYSWINEIENIEMK